MSEPTAPRGPGWWRPLQGADRRALWLMVLVPAAIFILPALLGHPAIAQDNFIQNYPLRVLTGRQILSGHLPLFNPLANAGTPLLGGMNAGSFYPLTMLFVFLPPLVAWVMNLIAIYVTAAIGMYSLMRWLGVRSSAAAVAAMTFAYGGAMMGQIVHIAVVQGFALLPWLVLTELVAARSLVGIGDEVKWQRHVVEAFPAIIGFGVIWGLTFLSGEPRAIAEAELVSLVVMAVELVVHSGVARATWRGRFMFLGANVVGAGWGVALGLIQLAPGWAFIAQSERSSVNYHFFSSGSLNVRWTTLLLNQTLLGGNGSLGVPSYFAHYNLAEVTGYVGIAALVATLAFLAQVTRRGWRRDQRAFLVFLVLIVVGLFAAWGNYTPVGHLFHVLPLFGRTRLQSRNIILVDLGATALMGWWLDAVFSRHWREASLQGWRRWFTAVPAMLAVVVSLVMVVTPATLMRFMGVRQNVKLGSRETLSVAIQLGVAISLVAIVVLGLTSLRARRWLIAVVVIDLICFNMFSDVGFANGSTPNVPSRASDVALLGDQGRYAIVDFGQSNFGVFESIGVPNLNVFNNLASVEGYGSLISAHYGQVTGTHPLVTLNRCTLVRGGFAQLRLDALVVSTSSLMYLSGHPESEPACAAPTREKVASRFFGTTLKVASLELRLARTSAPHSTITVQFFGPSGSPVGPPITTKSGSTIHVRLGVALAAAGFTVSDPSGVLITSAKVHAANQRAGTSWLVNGAFQEAMDTSAWRLSATRAVFSVFRATSLRAPQWLVDPAPSDRIVAARGSSWGDEWITIQATTAVTLVRSVAYLPGWRADLTDPANNVTATATVSSDGLVQKIEVPPGYWVIHFHYHAPYVETGLIVSGVSLVVLVAALVVVLRPRVRQWRRASVNR